MQDIDENLPQCLQTMAQLPLLPLRMRPPALYRQLPQGPCLVPVHQTLRESGAVPHRSDLERVPVRLCPQVRRYPRPVQLGANLGWGKLRVQLQEAELPGESGVQR